MKAIAYCSPFVPAEWIAAHGWWPHWLQLRGAASRPLLATSRGVCPYAGAIVDAAISGLDASALVLTTVCDQMRCAAAMLGTRSGCPVFLMNVPSTWQTAAVRKLYLDELRRLGRFLVKLGGTSPGHAELALIMLAHEHDRLAAKEDADGRRPAATEVPLAIIGGPSGEGGGALLGLVERAGGCVVLDATEGGPRTMPRRFDPARMVADPLEELADAYFDIPDVFRRPNHALYDWLGRELAARQVRGIIFRRYLWCDLWHAELQRLREWTALPVLEIDVAPDDLGASNRVQGRIEAFLEMLK
jgi:benzoyl-CoA reductase/2-hydroxyglutaryl-CoA dehydratase subunit BcrC/BadD/HgdB